MSVDFGGENILHWLNLEAHRKSDEPMWDLPLNHPVTAGVVPLFAASSGSLYPVGTAFFVSSLKIILTANHNITYVASRFHRRGNKVLQSIDDPFRKKYSLDDLNLYILLYGCRPDGSRQFRFWSVVSTTTPRPADITFGVLGEILNDDMQFLPFGLSPAVPRFGSRLWLLGYCDFSYPEDGIPLKDVRNGTFDWDRDYSHRLVVCEGEVDLIFTRRLASGFLEGPCVRVNCDIPHALSGGPAINAAGYVGGVNSAGSSVLFGAPGSLVSILYISLLSRLDLVAKDHFDPSKSIPVNPRVLDLILLGKVNTDKTEQLLGFSGPEEQGAVHPMIHEDDYDHAYEDLDLYTEKKPALANPFKEKMRRIFYLYHQMEEDVGSDE